MKKTQKLLGLVAGGTLLAGAVAVLLISFSKKAPNTLLQPPVVSQSQTASQPASTPVTAVASPAPSLLNPPKSTNLPDVRPVVMRAIDRLGNAARESGMIFPLTDLSDDTPAETQDRITRPTLVTNSEGQISQVGVPSEAATFYTSIHTPQIAYLVASAPDNKAFEPAVALMQLRGEDESGSLRGFHSIASASAKRISADYHRRADRSHYPQTCDVGSALVASENLVAKLYPDGEFAYAGDATPKRLEGMNLYDFRFTTHYRTNEAYISNPTATIYVQVSTADPALAGTTNQPLLVGYQRTGVINLKGFSETELSELRSPLKPRTPVWNEVITNGSYDRFREFRRQGGLYGAPKSASMMGTNSQSPPHKILTDVTLGHARTM
jgi:hypothetical protein